MTGDQIKICIYSSEARGRSGRWNGMMVGGRVRCMLPIIWTSWRKSDLYSLRLAGVEMIKGGINQTSQENLQDLVF